MKISPGSRVVDFGTVAKTTFFGFGGDSGTTITTTHNTGSFI